MLMDLKLLKMTRSLRNFSPRKLPDPSQFNENTIQEAAVLSCSTSPEVALVSSISHKSQKVVIVNHAERIVALDAPWNLIKLI